MSHLKYEIELVITEIVSMGATPSKQKNDELKLDKAGKDALDKIYSDFELDEPNDIPFIFTVQVHRFTITIWAMKMTGGPYLRFKVAQFDLCGDDTYQNRVIKLANFLNVVLRIRFYISRVFSRPWVRRTKKRDPKFVTNQTPAKPKRGDDGTGGGGAKKSGDDEASGDESSADRSGGGEAAESQETHGSKPTGGTVLAMSTALWKIAVNDRYSFHYFESHTVRSGARSHLAVCTRVVDNMPVVIKLLREWNFEREVEMFHLVSHLQVPFTVPLLASFSFQASLPLVNWMRGVGYHWCFVMPELHALKPAVFSRSQVSLFMYQLMQALSALHAKGLVHMDIALSNIMLNDSGDVQLIDFGFVLSAGGPNSRHLGTPGFFAPELWKAGDCPPQPSMDIFSAGVCFLRISSAGGHDGGGYR